MTKQKNSSLVKRLRQELEETSRKLKEVTTKDGLTQLYNHRHFYERVSHEFERCRRYQHPLSLLMMDVDYFKSVNDTYGHQAGDFVLVRMGELIRQSTRTVDCAARYGGDEFAVILPETTLSQSITLANRIRKRVEEEVFLPPSGKVGIHVTVSIGVASLAETVTTSDELITMADKGLYEAKKRGRATVCTHKDIPPESPLAVNAPRLSELIGKIHEITEEVKKGYLDTIISSLQGQNLLNEHSLKVSFLASQLAERLQVPEADIARIRAAGLLHDLGKVVIDEKILFKKGKLTSQEFQLLQRHPNLGAQILQQAKFTEQEAPMVLHHHERYDGYGYPSRLKGTEIPVGARILGIAEAWDTMTNDQPYRPALSMEKALEELHRGVGTQFDPDFAKLFIEMVQGA